MDRSGRMVPGSRQVRLVIPCREPNKCVMATSYRYKSSYPARLKREIHEVANIFPSPGMGRGVYLTRAPEIANQS